MNTDAEREPAPETPDGEYWDIPEIAMLLRLVTHLNVGATLALIFWFLTMTGPGSAPAAPLGAAANPPHACPCELMLVPIPQGPPQIANAPESSRS